MAAVPKWSRDAKLAKMLLLRMDGTLDASDLSALSGAPEEEVEALLAKLEQAGVVAFGEPDGQEPAPAGRDSLAPSGVSEEVRTRVTALYDRLDRVDHYGLLGVSATADNKTIRRAYFAQAKLYHPDRFFRRDIGALAGKIEAIFKAMTEAYETLSDPERRGEYDETLRASLRARLSRRSAEALDAAGDFVGSVAAWEKVADALPSDAYVLHRFARASLRAGEQVERGIAAAARAVARDPKRAEYRVTHAALLLSLGRERGALAELETAEQLEPDRADLVVFRAALASRVRRSLA